MILRGRIPAASAQTARRVERRELDQLDKFYRRHQAPAWTPLMFDMGPYYVVWNEGEIVAAAGVHFVTPYIAQIGNVFTHPDFRGRGFGTATTAAAARHLQNMGIPMVSLFVVADNFPAIRVYERLGFTKAREIVFAHFPQPGV
jgi:predicted GNAT family acetyltransferase